MCRTWDTPNPTDSSSPASAAAFAPAPAECEPGTLCALSHTQRVYKRMFWGVAALVLGALVFPYLMPFFY